MSTVPEPVFMSVGQASEYLQINRKKIYALVNEGKIPATKITGKWMFPKELVDQWMLNSAHGGLLTDRLLISGSEDPLLSRLVNSVTQENGAHALISYSPTSSQLGLDLLQARRVDAACIHWGPTGESLTRHPALLQQYSQHPQWVLIRAFQREQGLIVNESAFDFSDQPKTLFNPRFRWVFRQPGSGAQRFLVEILGQAPLRQSPMAETRTALSEHEAAAAIAMNQADIAPGTRSTAQEFGLHFIACGWAAFDIALRRDIWFRQLFQHLLTVLKSSHAQEKADELGGYDFTDSGKLIWGCH